MPCSILDTSCTKCWWGLGPETTVPNLPFSSRGVGNHMGSCFWHALGLESTMLVPVCFGAGNHCSQPSRFEPRGLRIMFFKRVGAKNTMPRNRVLGRFWGWETVGRWHYQGASTKVCRPLRDVPTSPAFNLSPQSLQPQPNSLPSSIETC